MSVLLEMGIDNSSLSASFPKVTTMKIFVECPDFGSSYGAAYDTEICMGELIRNLCVNLHMDPDTNNGVTKNFIVYRKNEYGEFIKYDQTVEEAECSISKLFTAAEIQRGELFFSFYLITDRRRAANFIGLGLPENSVGT
jgi:hypothetical protein